MIREVDFVDYYLPPFVRDYKEPVATLDAEQSEFGLIWKAADGVLKNKFIETADEYGIARFEKLLNIFPVHDDTLENRRARVRLRWFTMLPYTWRMLIHKLSALCGENDFTIAGQFDFYRIDLNVHLELSGQVEELERIIETMVPCNMVMDARNSIAIKSECAARVLGSAYLAYCYLITNDWKEKRTVEGAALTGSGIVETQNRMITNDWHEDIPVKSILLGGMAASDTVSVTIMETFKEQLTVDGHGSTGFGIAATECIEIN